MSTQKKGSCLCGTVRYEIVGNFESFFLCHCEYCRKDTGSAHASNLFSTTAELKWISGQSKIAIYNLPSTKHVKSFCSNCGSALPNIQNDGKLLVVPAGSLDEQIGITPNAHIFFASKANWDQNLENIATIDGPPG
ncbi:GFA family protein [cf. Phormidesmis sp. LEGE 11477]|uniref:GFA family protein n=1 Tax=cf. Phormidesmis sp. LEGE 11477 TaxID=1828680 RepID=UPI0018811D54|nr:GFA family protein [cf. Phormidesmis sp. LEGE 11477]MBE9059911.1 GFA family protein [cf. Phormidesmis sp. LEGE 11477]